MEYVKLIFQHRENKQAANIVSYNNNRIVGSFSNGITGILFMKNEYVDATMEIENTLENKDGISYLHKSKRETWITYTTILGLQAIQCLRNLETVSDLKFIYKTGKEKIISKLRVTNIEDTAISGIKKCTFEVLYDNNVILLKGKYSN